MSFDPAGIDPSAAAAFAALEAIVSGSWDRYLLRLQGAIRQRRETREYQDHIVAGADGTS